MSVTKSAALVRLVRKNLAGGFEKKESLPSPQSRFEKLGTIFSRTTGLIKSGVIPATEIPIWYSVYKTFPPKYEPKFKRPPLDVDVKDIYYPEDKLRAAMKKWDNLDLSSTTPNRTQKIVASFRDRRTSGANDDALIKELLESNNTEAARRVRDNESVVSEALKDSTTI